MVRYHHCVVNVIVVVNSRALRLHCLSVSRVGVREAFPEEETIVIVSIVSLVRISYMVKTRKRTLYLEKS